MNPLETIRRRGVLVTLVYTARWARRKSGWDADAWRVRHAPRYRNPTPSELRVIEGDLANLGVVIEDYRVDPEFFTRFKAENPFPDDYHGGRAGGVWDEKLLEHFIAAQLLGLDGFGADDVYVDVAACNSPWARHLREARGVNAWAIDLEIGGGFR
ncbi:hypothetical protein GWK36_01865 [Caldichromatium japonicum]|uniref:Uncharacterized protein n=1 Tax=Caldichromatium japonicum TaxID=2699430 RepID=A0A6G7VAH6_9GAMM|nr:hypothetical protein [Caldichromatium japonicum]QIK36952.1 hypothetical protein GWK36_01865 [Caldichromatium japonicum]